MFPDHYCKIFGLGERLGCILNLSHSFDAFEKFTFDKEPTAPSHGAGILGQIKGSDGKCFGVDGWTKPIMTSCDDSEITGERGLLVENSWYIIEHE